MPSVPGQVGSTISTSEKWLLNDTSFPASPSMRFPELAPSGRASSSRRRSRRSRRARPARAARRANAGRGQRRVVAVQHEHVESVDADSRSAPCRSRSRRATGCSTADNSPSHRAVYVGAARAEPVADRPLCLPVRVDVREVDRPSAARRGSGRAAAPSGAASRRSAVPSTIWSIFDMAFTSEGGWRRLPPPSTTTGLEVVLVDVLRCEHERRAEDDDRAVPVDLRHLERPERPGLERLT